MDRRNENLRLTEKGSRKASPSYTPFGVPVVCILMAGTILSNEILYQVICCDGVKKSGVDNFVVPINQEKGIYM